MSKTVSMLTRLIKYTSTSKTQLNSYHMIMRVCNDSNPC